MGFALWSLAANARLLPRLCLPSLFLALVGVLMLGNAETAVRSGYGSSAIALAGYFCFVAAGVAMTPAITGWHRLLINGSADRGDGSLYGWDWLEWRYFARWLSLAAMLALVATAIFAVMTFAAGDEDLAAPLVMVAMAGVAARFGLMLPAAAVGDSVGFARASAMVAGSAIRLTLALLLASAVATGLRFAFGLLFAQDIGFAWWGAFGVILELLTHIALLLITAGVLSGAYTSVRERGLAA